MLVPGAGEPNFDSRIADPFQVTLTTLECRCRPDSQSKSHNSTYVPSYARPYILFVSVHFWAHARHQPFQLQVHGVDVCR